MLLSLVSDDFWPKHVASTCSSINVTAIMKIIETGRRLPHYSVQHEATNHLEINQGKSCKRFHTEYCLKICIIAFLYNELYSSG